MMLDKFGNKCVEHVNNDYRVVGNGKWERSQNTRPTTQEAIDRYPEALFAGAILVDEDFTLYEKYFDIYNANLETEE